jgi:hypothetical protein
MSILMARFEKKSPILDSLAGTESMFRFMFSQALLGLATPEQAIQGTCFHEKICTRFLILQGFSEKSRQRQE